MSAHTRPPERYAIVNGHLVLPDRVEHGRALLIQDGTIEGIVAPGDLGASIERFDADRAYVLPGLIDIHTHGAVGRSFLDGTDEAFEAILTEHERRGVTGVLATTSTASIPEIEQALIATRAWQSGSRQGTRVLGAHVEGPYFHPSQAGAQDPEHVRTPDDGTVDAILAYADAIRILSFAPELPGAADLTRRLVAKGIVAAAGHSSTTEDAFRAAEGWGLSHVIHLWSAQSTTTRRGPYRVPGLLEASLASTVLTGEMIADDKHLPPTLMRLAYKCFGPDRLCVISDATSGAGLPDGSRFRMGGMEYEVDDGVGMMLDRSSFAGSTTFLDAMVRIVVERVGVSLPEAVRMASLTPARVIGLGDRMGSLAAGKLADLSLFDSDLYPVRTMIGGRWMSGGPAKGEPTS